MSMKAIVLKKFGGTDGLVLSEIPKPTPLPHDLIVKVKATSVNPIDTKVRKSESTSGPRENHVLGFDAAGIVEAVGAEAKLFKVGDEVYFAGSVIRNGTNAEYIAVDERIVGRKPKNLSWEQAAAIPLTGITAWEAIVEQLGIQPYSDNSQKSILIVAGAGGVGSIAIPLAKKVFNFGKVIATASRPETVEYVKKLGADLVIDHSKPDLVAQLKDNGIPNGVSYVFNCGEANKNFDQVTPTLAHFGKLVLITFGPEHPTTISQLFNKRCTVTWEMMFARPISGIGIEEQHKILNTLADLTEKGIIPDRATKILSLKNQLGEAHAILDSGRAIGKVVLTVDL